MRTHVCLLPLNEIVIILPFYSWRFGSVVTVMIHDFHIVKEALSRPEFLNRPTWDFFSLMEPNLGMINRIHVTVNIW